MYHCADEDPCRNGKLPRRATTKKLTPEEELVALFAKEDLNSIALFATDMIEDGKVLCKHCG